MPINIETVSIEIEMEMNLDLPSLEDIPPPPDMVASVKRNIRALFSRAMPSVQEISTLHGIIQALKRQRK